MTIEELKKLCEQATPGPWRAFLNDESDYPYMATVQAPADCSTCEPILHLVVDDESSAHWPVRMSDADASFIAAAREALPKLLAIAEASRYFACHEFEGERLRGACTCDDSGDCSFCGSKREKLRQEFVAIGGHLDR